MSKYEDPIANLYHDHVIVSFRDPSQPGRRFLALDMRSAIAETADLAAAIALAKRRSPPADSKPASELKPPKFKIDEETGALVSEDLSEQAVAELLQSSAKAE